MLVECPTATEGDPLLTELKRELAEAHEGLRIDVRLAERESLPRFELKAKRLVDERDRVGIQGRPEGDVTWPTRSPRPSSSATASAQLLECYESIKQVLTEHRDELPPFAERNAVKALAALWQVANGAGTQPGHIYDTGA